jgi:hypothetical protein
VITGVSIQFFSPVFSTIRFSANALNAPGSHKRILILYAFLSREEQMRIRRNNGYSLFGWKRVESCGTRIQSAACPTSSHSYDYLQTNEIVRCYFSQLRS